MLAVVSSYCYYDEWETFKCWYLWLKLFIFNPFASSVSNFIWVHSRMLGFAFLNFLEKCVVLCVHVCINYVAMDACAKARGGHRRPAPLPLLYFLKIRPLTKPDTNLLTIGWTGWPAGASVLVPTAGVAGPGHYAQLSMRCCFYCSLLLSSVFWTQAVWQSFFHWVYFLGSCIFVFLCFSWQCSLIIIFLCLLFSPL